MSILEKIKKVQSELEKNLDFVEPWLISDCINVIKSYYVNLILHKNKITLDDIDILESVSCCVERLYEEDFYRLLSKMCNLARENSKGACTIKKFLVPQELYNAFFSESDGTIRFLEAVLIPILFDTNNYIIGICDSKFKNIESKYQVLLGKLKR